MDENGYGVPQFQSQPADPLGPVPGQQALSLPWTPSDDMQLARLQKALQDAQNDHYAGVIDEPTFAQYHDAAQKRLQPLLARQQQQQAQKQQQATQQAVQATMQQEAVSQGIKTIHLQKEAEAFPKTVASFTDPLTGETEHFYPDSKGNWKPIEFAAHRERVKNQAPALNEDGSFAPVEESSGTAYHPLSAMLAGVLPHEGGNVPAPPVKTLEQLGQEKRQQSVVPGGTTGPRILNSLGEDITGQGLGQSTRGQRDSLGRLMEPIGGAEDTSVGGLTSAEMREINRQAESSHKQLGPGATVHEQLARMNLVGQTKAQIISHVLQRKRNDASVVAMQDKMTAQEEKHGREIRDAASVGLDTFQQKEAMRQQREAQVKEHKETLSKTRMHYEDQLNKMDSAWDKTHPGEKRPVYLTDPKERRQKLQQLMQEHLEDIGHKAPPEASTGSAPNPQADAIRKELERRASAVQAPASRPTETPAPAVAAKVEPPAPAESPFLLAGVKKARAEAESSTPMPAGMGTGNPLTDPRGAKALAAARQDAADRAEARYRAHQKTIDPAFEARLQQAAEKQRSQGNLEGWRAMHHALALYQKHGPDGVKLLPEGQRSAYQNALLMLED